MPRGRRRKCRHCGRLYEPDPRNRWHQMFCSQAPCQQASKRASQRRWARSALGRAYFRRPKNAQRVRLWRERHPGYGRKRRRKSAALQDVLMPQVLVPQVDNQDLHCSREQNPPSLPSACSSVEADSGGGKALALQDVLFLESPAWLGLMAQLTGVALPENIDAFTRRLILLGRQIQGQRVTPRRRSGADGEASPLPSTAAQSSGAVQLDRSAPGSG
jgi:hypothetical protein